MGMEIAFGQSAAPKPRCQQAPTRGVGSCGPRRSAEAPAMTEPTADRDSRADLHVVPTAAAVSSLPLLVDIPEVARLLGIRKTAANYLYDSGFLPTVSLGLDRRLVNRRALVELIDALTTRPSATIDVYHAAHESPDRVSRPVRTRQVRRAAPSTGRAEGVSEGTGRSVVRPVGVAPIRRPTPAAIPGLRSVAGRGPTERSGEATGTRGRRRAA